MIDQYKQAFQEEARELLVELEAALLELDRDRANLDVVGRAFRALHTIKGSGAMFGFDDIAGFTHHLENAFDQLRKGTLGVSSDLIRLALGASDQIKAMLEEAAGRGAADQGRSAEILTAVSRLAHSEVSVPAESESPATPDAPADAPAPAGVARQWRVHFRPGPEVLANGTNPLLLLGELRELGALEVQVDTAGVPPLAEIDADRCYLAWDLVLTTAAGRDAIRDVFIFIEEESELTIEADGREARRNSRPSLAAPQQVAPGGTGAESGWRHLHPRVGRQAGPADQRGRRAGHRAGPAERGVGALG